MSNVLDLGHLRPGDVVHIKTRDDHWWVGITAQTKCNGTQATSLMVATNCIGFRGVVPTSSSANRTLRRQGKLKINGTERGVITELYVNEQHFE